MTYFLNYVSYFKCNTFLFKENVLNEFMIINLLTLCSKSDLSYTVLHDYFYCCCFMGYLLSFVGLYYILFFIISSYWFYPLLEVSLNLFLNWLFFYIFMLLLHLFWKFIFLYIYIYICYFYHSTVFPFWNIFFFIQLCMRNNFLS